MSLDIVACPPPRLSLLSFHYISSLIAVVLLHKGKMPKNTCIRYYLIYSTKQNTQLIQFLI